MPRIRTIKPEFWGDEKLAPLTPIDRLVFLGLISLADDAGRIVDNVKTIDGFIFPDTDDTSRKSLDNLARTSRVLRYTSESGQKIIQIANWLRHQKVDHPAKYVLPPPPEASREPRESVALRPTTDDRRPVPTTFSSSSSSAAPDAAVETMAARLETEGDREALRILCAALAHPATWLAEMAMQLDGGRTQALSAAQLGEALRDYVANGAHTSPSLRHFRGYLNAASRPREPLTVAKGANGNGYHRPSAAERQRQMREAARLANGDTPA